MTAFHTALQAGIAFTWAGLVLGLSFIETPLKFHAHGITDVTAVGIGRLVFTTLNRIELVSLAILLASLLRSKPARTTFGIFSIIAVIVLMQTFWLLPVLDARVQLLVDGAPPAPSFHHVVYIGIESVKLLALLTLGIVTLRTHTFGSGYLSR